MLAVVKRKRRKKTMTKRTKIVRRLSRGRWVRTRKRTKKTRKRKKRKDPEKTCQKLAASPPSLTSLDVHRWVQSLTLRSTSIHHPPPNLMQEHRKKWKVLSRQASLKCLELSLKKIKRRKRDGFLTRIWYLVFDQSLWIWPLEVVLSWSSRCRNEW